MLTAVLIVAPTLVLWWWAYRSWVRSLREPWDRPADKDD